MSDPLGNRDLIYGVLPELTVEERRALETVDMTPILGTVEERLRFAMSKAMQFMCERDMALASEKQLRADAARYAFLRDVKAQSHSLHMDGQRSYRFRDGWPSLRGLGLDDAVDKAMEMVRQAKVGGDDE
jgi:hypothetical protein